MSNFFSLKGFPCSVPHLGARGSSVSQEGCINTFPPVKLCNPYKESHGIHGEQSSVQGIPCIFFARDRSDDVHHSRWIKTWANACTCRYMWLELSGSNKIGPRKANHSIFAISIAVTTTFDRVWQSHPWGFLINFLHNRENPKFGNCWSLRIWAVGNRHLEDSPSPGWFMQRY